MGKCGMCGDPVQGPLLHESGGKFANGIITKTYTKGQKIDVTLDLTANHGGWFEFQICGPMKDKLTKITDACLKNLNILGVEGKDLSAPKTRYTMPEKRKGKWNFLFNFHLIWFVIIVFSVGSGIHQRIGVVILTALVARAMDRKKNTFIAQTLLSNHKTLSLSLSLSILSLS